VPDCDRQQKPASLPRISPAYVLHIYCFDDAGGLNELATADDLIGFLHSNLTAHGCVDDLLCTDHPIPL
jgi:hypothetical protein